MQGEVLIGTEVLVRGVGLEPLFALQATSATGVWRYCHRTHPSVATSTASMVCRRFPAWSKTMLAGARKTSPVTSRPLVMPARAP